MRTYELMYIVDPRVSDDDLGAVGEAVQSLVGSGGATVIREEVWGRRKLAYPIEKQTEGKYVLLYLSAEEAFHGAAEVEKRMEQNDLILRYMIVRTDEDLKRAHGTVTEEIAAGGPQQDEESDEQEEAEDGEE